MSLDLSPSEVSSYYAARLPRLRQSGAQWRCPCPVHQGKRESFSVDPETGRACCHSACDKGWDVVGLEQELTGSDVKVALSEVKRLVGRDTATPTKKRIVAEYDYTDEAGALLYQCVRYEPKDFRQRRPDGQGGWVWNLRGVRLVPYRLPRVREASTVMICEGEKDVHTAESLGLVATCNAMGAGKWRPEYSEHLAGRRVVIIPDNDVAGRKHAALVMESLSGRAEVIIVEVPGVKDLTDWVAAGGTLEQLRALPRITDLKTWREKHGMDKTPEHTSAAPAAAAPAAAATSNDTRYYKHTDYGNAERLVKLHGADIRYSHQANRWFVWDAMRWKEDDTASAVRLAKLTVRNIYREAADTEDGQIRQAIATWAKKSESAASISAMLRLAQSEVPVLNEDLDRDGWLLNVRNGTIDLRTGELRPHCKEDLLTKVAPVDYDPAAKCPRWNRFLDEVFEPHPDLVPFLQRAIGYSMTADTREECFFLCFGTGRNGKGVFLKTLSDALGDYASTADFSAFLQRRGDGPRDDIANMRGRRLVRAEESSEGAALAESIIKNLTGGDRIRARRLHENSYEFNPTWKIWLASNYKPRVKGTDPAIWSRIKMIPFEVSFAGREDRSLKSVLASELPGILAWAVEGALRWREEGLAFPESVEKATGAYRAENDTVGRFLDDACQVADGFRAKARELYTAYRKWADGGGEDDSLSETAFALRLSDRGFKKQHTRTGWVYMGVGLRGPDARASWSEREPEQEEIPVQ